MILTKRFLLRLDFLEKLSLLLHRRTPSFPSWLLAFSSPRALLTWFLLPPGTYGASPPLVLFVPPGNPGSVPERLRLLLYQARIEGIPVGGLRTRRGLCSQPVCPRIDGICHSALQADRYTPSPIVGGDLPWAAVVGCGSVGNEMIKHV